MLTEPSQDFARRPFCDYLIVQRSSTHFKSARFSRLDACAIRSFCSREYGAIGMASLTSRCEL
jgi:hypothetical protein